MILQTVVFCAPVCAEREIYFRSNIPLEYSEGILKIKSKSVCSTDTYMNLLDLRIWKEKCAVQNIRLCLRIFGKGTLFLMQQENLGDIVLKSVPYESSNTEKYIEVEIPENAKNNIYFKLEAETEGTLYEAFYITEDEELRMVNLSLIITTYHRKTDIERNIKILKNSLFFKNSGLKEHLAVYVIDNGRELKNQYGRFIKVYQNPNTGGAGGFTRGIREILLNSEYETSHVIFMDDDVCFLEESLYRLYALMSYIRYSFCKEPVAGRMFRMDDRKIQYTAAEIWNGGKLQHIGWNQDMTRKENLLSINDNAKAEYGGWWFCCYPIDFVKTNMPLPFFLHCDDVEYGLRHGGTPVILNGIQVWHETYEYRQTPMIAYYDTRNSLIVNSIYQKDWNYKEALEEWKQIIANLIEREEWNEAYARIKGIQDYCKGLKWFYRNGEKRVKLKEINFLRKRKIKYLLRKSYRWDKIRK